MEQPALAVTSLSGLVVTNELAKAGVDVVLYEKEDYLSGHTHTINTDGSDVDLGFMVFNRVTCPNMMDFMEKLDMDMKPSDMSFSVSLDGGRDASGGSRNYMAGLFAQKTNAINPYFVKMKQE